MHVAYLLTPAPDTRIGIIASKKTGNAVKRNRARRIIRAATHSLLPLMTTPAWMVIIARSAINGKMMQEIHAELQHWLKQEKIIL